MNQAGRSPCSLSHTVHTFPTPVGAQGGWRLFLLHVGIFYCHRLVHSVNGN